MTSLISKLLLYLSPSVQKQLTGRTEGMPEMNQRVQTKHRNGCIKTAKASIKLGILDVLYSENQKRKTSKKNMFVLLMTVS